jgi:hypothetical protein
MEPSSAIDLYRHGLKLLEDALHLPDGRLDAQEWAFILARTLSVITCEECSTDELCERRGI